MINIQNVGDSQYFNWTLARYWNLADYYPASIANSDKRFTKNFDFKDIKLPVKIREIYKIEKMNSIGISVFGYENKEKHSIYVLKKCYKEKHILLLI